MRWRWTVAAKMSASFGLAVALTVVMAAVCWQSTRMLFSELGEVETHHDRRFALATWLAHSQRLEVAQRAYFISPDAMHLRKYQEAVEEVEASHEAVRAQFGEDAAESQEIQAIKRLMDQRRDTLQGFVEIIQQQGLEAAREAIRHDEGDHTSETAPRIARLLEEEDREVVAESARARQRANVAKWVSLVLGGLAVLVLGGIAFMLTRDVARPVRDLSSTADRIAAGDLTVRVEPSRRADEIGSLSRAFDAMVQSMRTSSQKIQEAVGVLAGSASEIATSVTQVTASTSQTASALNETVATVEEVRRTAEQSSQRARRVSEDVQRSVEVSKQGEKSLGATIAGMNHIREQMESIAASVVRLSEQSQVIGEIISMVDDLAEQSNLLAVNASIEAARAGEHGKGFAVVPQEVKQLAEQSKQATSQVRSILSDIQRATASAVMAIEQGGKAVEAGVRQSGEAGTSIQALASTVVEAAQAMLQVDASNQQQATGIEQVSEAMASIRSASSQNLESIRLVQSSADNLRELGSSLRELVQHYRV